jgi:pimeloyl-ACP methyl ester carboxylesterase
MTEHPEPQYVAADDGVRICVERLGDGPPLLLVPGLGAGSWLWEGCATTLARHFTLVMPELRGGGRSDRPDRRYSVARFAADMEAVLDAFDIERCDLLGASLGGFVAQHLAATRPERVRRLVLVATSVGGDEQVGPRGEMLSRTIRPRGRTRRERLEDAYELGFSEAYRRERPDVPERITAWRMAHPQPEWAYYRQLMAGAAYEGAAHARAIRAPTLVCMGRDDSLVPLDNARVLQRHIAQARLQLFEGRHLFFLEHGDAFGASVLDFLRGDAEPDTPLHPTILAEAAP